MAIYVMADNNVDIPVKMDAAMYDLFAGNTDYVIKGIRNELRCEDNNLVISCLSGECVIQGRHVTIAVDPETVTVPSYSEGYIVIRYDTNPLEIGGEAYLYATSGSEQLMTGDLNNSGTIRDLVLYSYTSTAKKVTLTDQRNLVDGVYGPDAYLKRGVLPDGTDLDYVKGPEWIGIWEVYGNNYTYYHTPEGMTGNYWLEVIAWKGNTQACLQRASREDKCAQRILRTNFTTSPSWYWLARGSGYNSVNPFKGRNVIYVGDSFLRGVGGERIGNDWDRNYGWGGWIDQLYSPKKSYYAQASGCGFVCDTGSAHKTFQAALKSVADSIDEDDSDFKSDIDYIIIVGGCNDAKAVGPASSTWKPEYEDFEDIVQSFCTYAKTTFPNAKIFYFCNASKTGLHYSPAYPHYRKIAFQRIIQVLTNNGIPCSQELLWWTYGKAEYCYSLDHIHLNTAGYQLYANLIASYISGGDITFHGFEETITLNDSLVSNYAAALPMEVTIEGQRVEVSAMLKVLATMDAENRDILIIPSYLCPIIDTYDNIVLHPMYPMSVKVGGAKLRGEPLEPEDGEGEGDDAYITPSSVTVFKNPWSGVIDTMTQAFNIAFSTEVTETEHKVVTENKVESGESYPKTTDTTTSTTTDKSSSTSPTIDVGTLLYQNSTYPGVDSILRIHLSWNRGEG